MTKYPPRGSNEEVSEKKFNTRRQAWPERGTEEKFSDAIPLLEPKEVHQQLHQVTKDINYMFTNKITDEITDEIKIATDNLNIIKANNPTNINEVEHLLTMLKDLDEASADNIAAKNAVEAA